MAETPGPQAEEPEGHIDRLLASEKRRAEQRKRDKDEQLEKQEQTEAEPEPDTVNVVHEVEAAEPRAVEIREILDRLPDERRVQVERILARYGEQWSAEVGPETVYRLILHERLELTNRKVEIRHRLDEPKLVTQPDRREEASSAIKKILETDPEPDTIQARVQAEVSPLLQAGQAVEFDLDEGRTIRADQEKISIGPRSEPAEPEAVVGEPDVIGEGPDRENHQTHSAQPDWLVFESEPAFTEEDAEGIEATIAEIGDEPEPAEIQEEGAPPETDQPDVSVESARITDTPPIEGSLPPEPDQPVPSPRPIAEEPVAESASELARDEPPEDVLEELWEEIPPRPMERPPQRPIEENIEWRSADEPKRSPTPDRGGGGGGFGPHHGGSARRGSEVHSSEVAHRYMSRNEYLKITERGPSAKMRRKARRLARALAARYGLKATPELEAFLARLLLRPQAVGGRRFYGLGLNIEHVLSAVQALWLHYGDVYGRRP